MQKPPKRPRRRSMKARVLTMVGILLAVLALIEVLTRIVQASHDLWRAVGMI